MIIAGVPLEEYGDTMNIVGVIIGDGHKQVQLYLPATSNDAVALPVKWSGVLSLPAALAWLQQSDDPTSPVYTTSMGRFVKAIVRKATRQVDQNVAWTCYARDGYECRYCGAIGVPLTYDHLLAQAFGGKTTVENGVSACRPCNKAKGHLTLEAWVEYMKEKGMKYAAEWEAKSSKSLPA